MSVVGKWLVDFDWGLDGTWEVISIDFSADGTWTGPGPAPSTPAQWFEIDGLLLMISVPPDGANVVFAANRVRDAMVGISSNTANTFHGVFRARRVPTALPDPGLPELEELGGVFERFMGSGQ